jgi:hypothetical protein
MGSSTITVIVGAPRISIQAGTATQTSPGVYSIPLTISNTGTGNAVNLKISSLALRVIGGTGAASVTSPATPLVLGSLDVGATTNVILTVNAAATVTRVSITESGTLQSVVGTNQNYSLGQAVILH